MKVHVTQKLIDRGNPLCHATCPIAEATNVALQRAGLQGFIVSVDADSIELLRGHDAYEFQFGVLIEDWIASFDNDAAVSPFTFEIPIERRMKNETPIRNRRRLRPVDGRLPRQAGASV